MSAKENQKPADESKSVAALCSDDLLSRLRRLHTNLASEAEQIISPSESRRRYQMERCDPVADAIEHIEKLRLKKWDYWWMDVKNIGRLVGFKPPQLATLDESAWRKNYFEESFTPAEAWQSEHKAGNAVA